MLEGITYRTVFFEMGPSYINATVWNNIVNLVSNVSEFFGRYLGYLPVMEPIVDLFHWFPWVHNILVCGLYLWGNQSMYDTYWPVFTLFLFFLCFRVGITISLLVSRAIKQTHDPNAPMMMNYLKNFGIAVGGVLSLLIHTFKH